MLIFNKLLQKDLSFKQIKKSDFLDRDGVINHDYGYVHEIEKFEFVDGVLMLVNILSL